ncbi:MAG: GreA/GreB family elongation factor [Pseudomonadota bacterium]|uniref:GreA/GreB family elongation factor n=1 Tax=Roseovarius TaxID=74030 RepID=UPI0022A82352|nr:GreA/GreB family elongation factor [Roseovarius sp. EGI FJ00037]MCZ0812173.1 GreA/GreB family elongation factor [Roseovarius sp. EGI FJ00037]
MNKAFTKEEDSSTPQRLPDLPISKHPNHVTPKGLAQLQTRKAALEAEIARLRGQGDHMAGTWPLAVAERDLRYVEARLASAIVIAPHEDMTPPGHVQFGATVHVADEDGREAVYTIVGEDEAAPADGLISAHSPLARALLEAGVGDLVEWPKPTGTVELEVLEIRFAR